MLGRDDILVYDVVDRADSSLDLEGSIRIGMQAFELHEHRDEVGDVL